MRFAKCGMFGWLVLLALLLMSPPAWAEEGDEAAPEAEPAAEPAPKKSYVEARAEFDAAAKQGESAVLIAAVSELLRAVDGAEPKQSKDVRKALKKLLKRKDEAIVVAALQGYGSLRLKRSSNDLKKWVDKKASKKKSLALRKEAIKAWARISDPGTHEALLEYIKLPTGDRQLLELAVVCATEMRHFTAETRKKRGVVIDDFMKAFDMVHSAGIGAYMPSAVAADWWDRLKDPMLESVCLLTDVKFESYPACRDWWRKARKTWR